MDGTRGRGAVDLHGLHLCWETTGLEPDPCCSLLGLLPPYCGREPADVVLVVEATARLPGADGFRDVFFQGNVRGLERDGEIRLLAPSAGVVIPPRGRRIEAYVDAATLNPRGFTQTTLVIALAVALRHHGLFHLHAGALVRGAGARRVLVVGDSGAGKSTVTLGLLDAGARPLGDDTLFVGARDGLPMVLSFPRPFHLAPATVAAFPGLRLSPADVNGKRDLALEALPGRTIDRMAAPDVVLFPHVTTALETRAAPLAAADAFGQVVRASALVVVDGLPHKAQHLDLLAAMLSGARAYELALGGDWLADPGATVARLGILTGAGPA